MKLARLVFRIALRMVPPRLRERHGPAMEDLFLTNYAEARGRGIRTAVTMTAVAAWDAVVFGLSRRRADRRARSASTHDHPRGRIRLDTVWFDVRHAARSLRRAPRHTLFATLTVALGIGANAAMFSVVNGVLLEPLPFHEPDRVVHLGWEDTRVVGWMTAWQYEFWRDHTDVFTAVATYRGFEAPVGAGDETTAIRGLHVTHRFLDVLGISPVRGRSLTADDDRPGAAEVIIISQRVWRRHFGSAPDVVGRTLTVNERPRTVIGVLPSEFQFPHAAEYTDAIVPLALRADPQDEGQNYPFIARLRPGVSHAVADAQVRAVTEAFRDTHPELMLGTTMRLASYQEIFVGGLRSTLLLLMAAVGLVLLIACANVANLSLARASGRARELAVRSALGATRGRITAHLLIESLLVASLGGVVSLAAAPWVTNALLAIAPAQLPRLDHVNLNWDIVGFTFLMTLATGVAVGLAAATVSARRAAGDALRDGAHGTTPRGTMRQSLLAVEAAFSMVLLVGAGLLISTLRELHRVDMGFPTRDLVTVRLDGSASGYRTGTAVGELERRVIDGLANYPAVERVAGAANLPLERGMNLPVTVTGRPNASEGAVEWRAVTDGYVETLGMTLVRGRSFTARDNAAGAPPVAIVNEAFANRYFGGDDPIGQRLEIGRFRGRYIHPDLERPPAEIVGVVTDIRDASPRIEPRRTVFVPHAQAPDPFVSTPVFLVRGSPSRELDRAIREVIAGADPRLAVSALRPMDELMGASVARERFNAVLMSAFAGLALVLTVVGLYGVVAYDVRRRSREIGIRLALGAGASSVVRLTVRRGMTPVVVGLAAGTLATLALSRLVTTMLWGVTATDPTALLTGAGTIAAAALVAAYLPARAAARNDPVAALSE